MNPPFAAFWQAPLAKRGMGALPYLVVALSLAGTFVAWRASVNLTRQEAATAFRQKASDIVRRIDERLRDDEQILLGARGLFLASNNVSRAEWRRYVAALKLEDNFPGIQGVGFSQWLTAAEKDAHVRAVQAEGYPEYNIQPAGVRETYTAIVFIEPFDWRNQRAFGFDMYSEEVRRAAMERARSADVTALSSRVILKQETEEATQNGVLMYVPVYRQGLPTGTPAERRAALFGFVYSPLRVGSLVQSALRSMPTDIGFRIAVAPSGAELFRSPGGLGEDRPTGALAQLARRETLELYGQTWVFEFHPQAAFAAAFDHGRASQVLGAGLCMTMLLSLLVYSFRVTHRRAIALSEAHDRLQRLGDHLPDGCVFQLVWAPDGTRRFAYLSAGVERLFSLTVAEARADSEALYRHVVAEDRAGLAAAGESARRELGVLFAEFRVCPPGGSERWIQLRSSPAKMGDGTVVWDGIALDITERKRAEADRLVLSKLESTGILAGGIAHDFNNLLTVILLGLQLTRARYRGSPEEVASLLDAEQAARSAQQLAAQLITFAEGGDPVRRPAHLAELVRRAVEVALSGSNVSSQIALPEDLWAAEVDPRQIGQVFRNLVLNAREAMPKGGKVSVSAANVTLAGQAPPALPAGDYVRIGVADEGSGIAPEIRSKIFDPYFSTKQRGSQKGMGLGLTICHTVIQKHGGAITVESPPGRGATFAVYLPAFRSTVPPPAPAAPPAAVTAATGRVLVMDDEQIVRNTVGRALQRAGYEVVLAAEGQEAVDRYAESRAAGRPFDLVLLDLTVRDGMSGLEAMRRLKARDPAVRAVSMSGYSNSEAMRDFTHFGFLDALNKPFDADALCQLVARLMPPRPAAGEQGTPSAT